MKILLACALICVYLPLSIGLTFYNRYIVKEFKFPLFVLACHFSAEFLLASLVRWLRHRGSQAPLCLGWSDVILRIGPVAAAASIDIGLSVWSLEFINVSLYTMCKSSVIIFILLFAFCLKMRKPAVSLLAVVLLIFAGLFLFFYKSGQFNGTGFLLVELAALCAGLRWNIAQLVLQKQEMGLTNPLDVIYFFEPCMLLTIVPMVFVFEGKALLLSTYMLDYSNVFIPLRLFGLSIIGGILAFSMECAEYGLLVNTSSLTLSVVGVVKEITAFFLGRHFSKSVLSPMNKVGLCLCFSGIFLYTYREIRLGLKTRREKLKAQEDVFAANLRDFHDSSSDESDTAR